MSGAEVGYQDSERLQEGAQSLRETLEQEAMTPGAAQ